ncbi:hypothetical protein A9Q84_21220 [Halobacteriovorax marinus]|uniref:Uncharacterized protein n=1 Tax=Halobacteriovorax marinus TaxID=97084 RepID=A0A1Y5F1M7_9BACT|nr:hypothetical protein A9Q84_21220 [Halobacteriovorax marinus]
MTSVTINNKFIQHSEKDLNVNDLMEFILKEVLHEDEVITSLDIDGKQLSYEEEQESLSIPVAKYSDINFSTTSSYELAFEALNDCSSYIDTIVEKINLLTEYQNENKQHEANLMFGEVIEIMDLFVQLMSRIYKTVRKRHTHQLQATETFQQLEIHLLSIMKTLLPAKEKNDIIMLNDLLEYELIDNLTQWKIKAIPELKKLRDL